MTSLIAATVATSQRREGGRYWARIPRERHDPLGGRPTLMK